MSFHPALGSGGSLGSYDFWIQFGLSQWNEAAGEGSWGGRREREKEVGGLLLVSLNLGRPQVAAAVLLSEPLYTDALSDFSGVSSNWSLQTWIFSLVLSLNPSHLF